MTSTITTIKEQVKAVIEYSQNLTNVQVDGLMERWQTNKQFFLDAWGGPIYEVGKVSFELSQEEKDHRLNEFLNSIETTYYRSSYDLVEFLDNVREEFFSNHLVHGYRDIVPKGTKIVKAFKYFVTDQRMLEDLQNQASMIIQEDKVTGTLCFSVHPLDYLSSSENNYHWRSCHALDGDYRAGNLSYMVDNCTVVCYLRGGINVRLPRFPETVLWNNKKWRMLLYTHPEALFAGRQYPFFSPSALTHVQKDYLLSIKRSPFHWSQWHQDFRTTFPRDKECCPSEEELSGRHISMFKRIYRLKDIVKDKSRLHFNDVLESSCYDPYYCWHKTVKPPTDLMFNVGGEVKCLCCGSNHIQESDIMICDNCIMDIDEAEYRYCDCCDTRHHINELIGIRGYYYCPECLEEYFSICECCGEIVPNAEIKYDQESQKYICLRCKEDLDNGARSNSES